MNVDWKNILFWMFLVLSIILLIWHVFGSTPSEFITIITIIFTVLIKMWSISDRQIRLEMRFNTSEDKIKDSFVKLKEDIDLIKNKLLGNKKEEKWRRK